jgi:hypothetical protein
MVADLRSGSVQQLSFWTLEAPSHNTRDLFTDIDLHPTHCSSTAGLLAHAGSKSANTKTADKAATRKTRAGFARPVAAVLAWQTAVVITLKIIASSPEGNRPRAQALAYLQPESRLEKPAAEQSAPIAAVSVGR